MTGLIRILGLVFLLSFYGLVCLSVYFMVAV